MTTPMPTTTSAAVWALAPTCEGGGYMTLNGRTAYVRPGHMQHTIGRRGNGWVVEIPRAHEGDAPATVTLAWCPTFLSAARIALAYAAREGDWA